jgi:hypothetical protein
LPRSPYQIRARDTNADLLAREERQTEIEIEELNIAIAQAAQQASAKARQRRIDGLLLKEAYLGKDVGFRARRTEAAKDIVRIRIAELVRPDGALSYHRRIQAIRARVIADLQEAFARMKAAGEGLKLVYGIDLTLPSPDSTSFLDDAVTWVRAAQARLARIARLDQSYVFRVSMKSRMEASPDRHRSGLLTF